MNYYGIDIHKKYSVYTVVNQEGKVIGRGRIDNNPESFTRIIRANGEGAKAVIEATGNWYYIHDLLENMVEEVVLAHPQRTKAIASARIKTDKIDATTLAQLLRNDYLPRSYIAPREIRDLRELLRNRAYLVRIRTRIKNKVHAILIKNGLRHEFSDLFGRKGRKWLESLELRKVFRQILLGYLRHLDYMEGEILAFNREINQLASRDNRAKILDSIPGIGPYTAMLILSEIGDINRFPDASNLVSYAGLNPSVYSSGGITRYGKISKQGSSWLRWILVEVAQVAARCSKRFSSFHQRIALRHGKKAAKVALGREILRLCYHLLKKEEVYQE